MRQCLDSRGGCPPSDSRTGCAKTAGRTGPLAGALLKGQKTPLLTCSTPEALTLAVTPRMADTSDSRSAPPRPQTGFFCSGLAEQLTFNIDGWVWSILASYRDCSTTPARAHIVRSTRNEDRKYVPFPLRVRSERREPENIVSPRLTDPHYTQVAPRQTGAAVPARKPQPSRALGRPSLNLHTP